MNDEKENFVFLASWVEAIEAYDNAGQPELAGELAKQIIYYGTKGKITTDNPLIHQQIKLTPPKECYVAEEEAAIELI